jgi:diguanylate cyclase (GGDEF)-like protein
MENMPKLGIESRKPVVELTPEEQELLDVLHGVNFNDEADLSRFKETLEQKTGEEVAIEDSHTYTRTSLQLFKVLLHLEIERSYDKMTDLLNFAGLSTRVEKIIKEAKENNTPLAAVSIDLNGLKGINDHFGHLAGDRAIKITAYIIDRAITRRQMSHTIASRNGGDEFYLWAFGEDVTQIEDLCATISEHMRTIQFAQPLTGNESVSVEVESILEEPVSDTDIQIADRPIVLRAPSIGIEYWKPGESDFPPEELAHRADTRQMEAKNAFYRDNPHLKRRGDDSTPTHDPT